MEVAQVPIQVRTVEALAWSDGESDGREGGSREEGCGRGREAEVVAEEQSHSGELNLLSVVTREKFLDLDCTYFKPAIGY